MLVPINFPAGLVARGTDRQSEGFWIDADLVRFYEGSIRPIGGWYRFSKGHNGGKVVGKGREIFTWSAINNSVWCAIGTDQGLFAMTKGGTLSDITPASFVSGRDVAANGGGYGSGAYGVGAYGVPIASDNAIVSAMVWSLDNFGEDLIGCPGEGQPIYRWHASTPSSVAAELPNAPTANAVIVTGEDIVMALGADGDPRLLKWSHIRDAEDWTSTPNNRAGDLRVPTSGVLAGAVNTPGGVLLFSEADVWIARFVGALGYGVDLVADGAGSISRNSMVKLDGQVLWMGQEGFWSYAGQSMPLSCDVADAVFSNLNRTQLSLVTAWHNSSFGEVWWFYPSLNSNENDRYVIYSYREGTWCLGSLDRTACADIAPFAYALMVGADGYVYAHETGQSKEGRRPYLIGGPLSLGESVATVSSYIPDGLTVGDTELTLTTRYRPHGEEFTSGPYVAADKTDIRVTGREIDLRYDMKADDDWRIGVPQFEITARGVR